MLYNLGSNINEAVEKTEEILEDLIKCDSVKFKLEVRLADGAKETSWVFLRKYNKARVIHLKTQLKDLSKPEDILTITLHVELINHIKRSCPNCGKEMRSDTVSRHLKACVKGQFCPICETDVTNDIKAHINSCSRKLYQCRICKQNFNTGARRTAHEKKCRVGEEAGPSSKKSCIVKEDSTLNGLFSIISLKPAVSSSDYEGVLEDEVEHIKNILQSRLKTWLKFYISLELNMRKDVEGMEKLGNFQSSATSLYQSSDVLTEIRKHVEVVVDKIDNYTRNGSGWVVGNIHLINLMIVNLNSQY